MDLQHRLKGAEGYIQVYKREVNKYASEVSGYEERLGLLVMKVKVSAEYHVIYTGMFESCMVLTLKIAELF